MWKLVICITTIVGTVGCDRRNDTSVDPCHEIRISGRNLSLLVEEYYGELDEWPNTFEDLADIMKSANTSPDAFSGGPKNWEFKIEVDGGLSIHYIGLTSCELEFLRFYVKNP